MSARPTASWKASGHPWSEENLATQACFPAPTESDPIARAREAAPEAPRKRGTICHRIRGSRFAGIARDAALLWFFGMVKAGHERTRSITLQTQGVGPGTAVPPRIHSRGRRSARPFCV